MARPQKYNLDYFSLDCGFFQDEKIKRLRRRFGAIGILTYINLLTRIYGSAKGYYIKVESLEDLSYDIAEDIAKDQIDRTARQVYECIFYCADLSLLCCENLKRGVITGGNIQSQYRLSTAQFRRKAEIREYALIEKEPYSEYPLRKNGINAEETAVNVEETAVNVEFSTQKERERNNKEKYIKRNSKTEHFASERNYAEGELDKLLDKVEDIKF